MLYRHLHDPGKGILSTTQAVHCITANAHLAHSFHMVEQQAESALAATDRRLAQKALKHMPMLWKPSAVGRQQSCLKVLCPHLHCCSCCGHKLPLLSSAPSRRAKLLCSWCKLTGSRGREMQGPDW